MPATHAHSGAAVHPTPLPLPLSIQRPELLLNEYNDASDARYSVAKFKELTAYCDDVSSLRVTLVLLLMPLPGLITAVLPALLPLQAPQLGYNVAFFCHAAFVDFSCGFGIIIIWCSVTEVPQSLYSRREAVVVSLVNTALHILLLYLTARFWRFPIPFSWVLFASVFLGTLMIAHLLVLRRKLLHSAELHRALRTYSASMLFQSSQILLYPAFSVLFDYVSNTWRIVLTLLFPLLKLAMKYTLERLSRHFRDHNAHIAECGVEICASLYQSMILQTSPASSGIPFIIGLEVLKNMIVVKLLLDRHVEFSRPNDLLMDTASALIRRFNVKSELNLSRPSRTPRVQTAPALGRSASFIVPPRSQSADAFILRDAHSTHQLRQNLLIQNALAMAFVAEQVVLVEYIEVFVPLLNSFFLLLTARLPSAQFNPRLLPFYTNDDAFLWHSIGSIWLYSLLQAVSLIAMHVLMKRRYGFSGIKQLAFVLERHRVVIVGILIVWPPFILHFPVVQYGEL